MSIPTDRTDVVLRASRHALARWRQRFAGAHRADLIRAANCARRATPTERDRLHLPVDRRARVDPFLRAVFILAPCRERPGQTGDWIVVSVVPLEGT